VISEIRSRRDPPTLSVPALKSGRMSHAIECMSSWVGSWLSCCHRGIWPGLGMLSEYGRMFHLLGSRVGGMGCSSWGCLGQLMGFEQEKVGLGRDWLRPDQLWALVVVCSGLFGPVRLVELVRRVGKHLVVLG
jgi:hypothetical protein